MSIPKPTLRPIEKWVHCPQCGRSLAPALDLRKKGDHITCSACDICLTCERDEENRPASDSPE